MRARIYIAKCVHSPRAPAALIDPNLFLCINIDEARLPIDSYR